MPSNSMKISQFVTQLQALQAAHGDIDVILSLSRDGELYAIDGRNVNVGVALPWVKLPQPALLIGLSQDQYGTLTTAPGTPYHVTADASEWNHNRFDAPLGEDVAVWRRGGAGADKGRRTGADEWWVYDGGERLVQIVPAAILGWKSA